MPNANGIRKYKSIRDPLYGFVDLTRDEIDLVDTPVFRRLQGIKQLSHAYLAYPSAIHTRFEHSLGVLHSGGQKYPITPLPRRSGAYGLGRV